MNSHKIIYLFKNIIPNNYKNLQFFRFFFSNYSNCHRTYGDFDDKENIN